MMQSALQIWSKQRIFHEEGCFITSKEKKISSIRWLIVLYLIFFREGESFIESPKSATPLKDFLAHCTKIIGERMLHFSETLGASVTAASFMSFILYLKEHYASWQEKIQEYEEQEVKTWNEVIELAKKKREIREDIDNGQIITVFRTLYLGLSYKGALIDRLSIEELQRLWEFIYQEYKL